MTPDDKQRAAEIGAQRSQEVCVHGLGYIGLPTAAMLANYGYSVTGYDVDKELRETLEAGEVPVEEPGLRAFVTQALDSGNLHISAEIIEAKYHVICVPTPFSEDTREADLSYVKAAGRGIREHVRRGDTVILESTVPPGTTSDVLKPILEESGLDAGEDFALVYCPETVLPGNIITELRENDKVVGGVNGVSNAAAVRLYESFVEGDIHTTVDSTTAEFVKLAQNTYRDVNIALANELAKIAAEYGIDSRTAIEQANRHPRVEIHQPGPGVGGHCLPADPWFLTQGSDQTDLIERARAVNDGMADYICDRIEASIGSLADARIAVLGLAYKGNVDDVRNSPGLALAQRIEERATADDTDADLEVRLNDPHVTVADLAPHSVQDAVTGADVAVVTTDHDEYADLTPDLLATSMDGDLVVDSKAILDRQAFEASPLSYVRI